MRVLALMLAGVFLLSGASVAAVKKREWQDGTVVNITSEAPGTTAPGAETVFRYRIQRAYYWIKVGNWVGWQNRSSGNARTWRTNENGSATGRKFSNS
jgi:NAD(P)-dependent dehydrogenase (short-subunit alcohol dehydrogenase family)